MNKGVKTLGVIGTLLLLSILLFAILLSAAYPLPFQLEKFRFFSITNSYVQQYVFWLAVAFAILTIITLLVFLFYPKTIGTFLLKHGDGELTLDKKAIEGMVRSHLHEDEFIHSPKGQTLAVYCFMPSFKYCVISVLITLFFAISLFSANWVSLLWE